MIGTKVNVIAVIAQIAGIALLIAVLVGIARLRTALYLWMTPSASDGTRPRPTIGARLKPSLSLSVMLVARTGLNADPGSSLDTWILRPTPGMRIISLGLASCAVGLIWTVPELSLGTTGNAAITMAACYSALFIGTYELRFDRDMLSAPNWLFQRREHAFGDLIDIRDDGHYHYRFRFSDGRTLQVQKYLVGIDKLLGYGRQWIDHNIRG
ncbi:MAG: hypothetical protein HLUCCA08_03625 [Rhodobacteraceae bacterium HLUCCA08]|nr:MAG: hypothetical protein HLUCCA08_03625 [Rhodobacteraceae bacterium HLUCCA08]